MAAQLLKGANLMGLFYHGAVFQFKSKSDNNAKPETLSRIYHSIANLKKKEKVDKEKYNH